MSQNSDLDTSVLEIKSRLTTLFTLQLSCVETDTLLRAVDRHVEQAPAMFRGMPVVLDLDRLERLPDAEMVKRLVSGLHTRRLVPTALGSSDEAASGLADQVGLPLLRAGAEAGPPRAEPAAAPQAPATRFVTRPVRSGQQVYARGGDLVILAPVGPGAEVLADGCVHVYGALNGRAGAGVQGDETARVFCQQFNAELISIAGRYQVGDDLSEAHRNRAVQIRLDGDALSIERLEGA